MIGGLSRIPVGDNSSRYNISGRQEDVDTTMAKYILQA